jgi:hypothetical protein
MIKRELLEKLSSAKRMQKNNLQKALLLAKGITGEDDPVTVDYKACAFEKLLHENEAVLKKIVGNRFFSEIEALHRQWHQDYCKIYDLYYHQEKGFISKWFGGNPKPTERELELAGSYSADLKEATWKIVHLLELVESRIKNMKDEVL